MTAATLLALLPLCATALGAVLAMLLAPRSAPRIPRAAAAIALLAGAALAAARLGGPVQAEKLFTDDGLARLGQVLANLSGLGALAFLRPPRPAREGPALICLATLGAGLLSGASHAATLFLGLELITLSLVALFVLPVTKASLEAGYKLLILGAIGAATLLMALALAYAATGSLGLEAWSENGATLRLATALLVAALAFKFALVPFHMWAPDGFAGAAPGAAAMAGTTSKIGVAILMIRLDAAAPAAPVWTGSLALLAGVSMLLGNLQALRQPELARMLGFTSVAHSGYVAALLASGATIGPEAMLFYLSAYAAALTVALCAAACLGPGCRIDTLTGMAWARPLPGGALALALISMIGLPVSAGFFGKLYLFTGLIEAGAWGLLGLAAIGTALGVYVYGRFLAELFRTPAISPAAATEPWPEALALLIPAMALLILGLYPAPLSTMIRAALP